MRGNILGSLVTQIYVEVFELVKVFAECKYDPLDPGDSVGLGPQPGREQVTPWSWGGHPEGVWGNDPTILLSKHAQPGWHPHPPAWGAGRGEGVRVSTAPALHAD